MDLKDDVITKKPNSANTRKPTEGSVGSNSDLLDPSLCASCWNYKICGMLLYGIDRGKQKHPHVYPWFCVSFALPFCWSGRQHDKERANSNRCESAVLLIFITRFCHLYWLKCQWRYDKYHTKYMLITRRNAVALEIWRMRWDLCTMRERKNSDINKGSWNEVGGRGGICSKKIKKQQGPSQVEPNS